MIAFQASTVTVLGPQPQFIWVPIGFGILLILAVLLGVLAMRSGSFGATFTAAMLGVLALCTGIVWAILPIPYQSQYWSIYRVSGQVTSVTNGFTDGGGDATYRVYVTTLKGDPRPYVLDDPRASQLEGKAVDLTCGVEWVYASADRWNCTIGAVSE